ncbi:cobalt-precorrin-5B (C(1))-methyltransferase [Geothermobacter hydrogeniphilus]|uniref:Cobalt-precorrin-5B C(1)-methyltransferase n=1 Tax=Geothermobacter hydrogeniphilus TaxID=1969733 RepID=A0A2K2H6H4_9BACT|nr:cobalt-precorrin-5B (C(1))-methyltransferase CbiD [Geothermobacter hydrogeniphilus]PNU18847.1 cobalt-precorrin-5B (C(1))-methyltransferase [Geothermobacter hydrogeniphilus]
MVRFLRHGYTTGACAAAATLAAARLLAGERVAQVALELPVGERAVFPVHGCRVEGALARCFVIKDAGDDPDVTHGVEVHILLERIAPSPGVACSGSGNDIRLFGGEGIGTVTKPGLAVAVGEPAINPVPRRMIREALRSVFPTGSFRVTIAIPDGEQRAAKTLNARLGILGGLSILGTTGIVRPISHQAWTDTLDVALNVARAAGCRQVVACTGRNSERAAQRSFPQLTEEAFVMMGDHVGYLAGACHRKGMPKLVVAAQFAKLVKIACGHPQTHVHSSRVDLRKLADWALSTGLTTEASETIAAANTAREVFLALGAAHPLVADVARRAVKQLRNWAPGVTIEILLVSYDGAVAGKYGE